tara:strand:+ start:41 stop:220 length:180 start_codon:yes stop_codon:yes gene_type:complete
VSYFLGAFLGALMGFLGHSMLMKEYLIDKGMIQVASGQYECTLEAKEDKTTEWVCGATG